MSGGFSIDDYVDVAERISKFYETYPDGRLTTGSAPQIIEADGKSFVVYHAQAWRTPDDPHPGDGWAWEPIPGPTQFTRDSELMNAETAAWGRAIVSLGFETKKIASAQEVRNRTGDATDESNGGSPLVAEGGDPGEWAWPFGKHKGVKLKDTDVDYVQWYAKEGTKSDIREVCSAYLAGGILIAAGADDDIPFDRTIDGLGN